MATVGKVVAVLAAQTSNFDRALRSSAAKVRAFGAGLAQAAAKVALFGAGLVAAAAAALTVMVKRAFEAVDGLAKMAQSLGIATDKLAAFRFAADLAGISSEQLDMALKKMISSVADLETGSSSMVRAFGTLGLTAEQLRGLRPDEIFSTLAEAVRRSGSSVEVLAAVMDIFGSRVGLQMIPLLREGSAGLAAFEAEARALGIAISDIDAAKIEAANDAWTRFQTLIAGIGQQIAIQVAPIFEALITRIVGVATASGGMGKVVSAALEVVVVAIGKAATAVQALILAWHAVQAAVMTFGEFALRGITGLATGIEWLLDQLGILDSGWAETLQLMTEEFGKMAAESRQRVSDEWSDLASDPWGDRLVEEFKRIQEEAERAAEEAVRLRRDLEIPALPQFEDLEDQIEKVTDAALSMQEAAVEPAQARRGQFGEADLSTINLGRTFGSLEEKVATEDGQKRVEALMRQILGTLQTPPPMLLAWE